MEASAGAAGRFQRQETVMTRVVRCSCGTELRDTDEATLITRVKQHASEAHDLALSDDQVRDMIEVEA